MTSERTPASKAGPAQQAREPAFLLQRKCGCGAGATMLSGECEECQKKKLLGLQAKLERSNPGDRFEAEADRAADKVMSGGRATPTALAPLRLHRLPTGLTQPDHAPVSVRQVVARPGTALDPHSRSFFESRFGYDFSRVRVHRDGASAASADALGARAYTVGHHIVFADGAYAPDTERGRTLIAHELAHVVQQRGGEHRIQRQAETAGRAQVSETSTLSETVDTVFSAIGAAAPLFPGLAPLAASHELIRSVMYLWGHREEMREQLLTGIGDAAQMVPKLANAKMQELLASTGTAREALTCVGNEMMALLESLAQNWREVLSDFIDDMFGGVFFRAIPAIIENLEGLAEDLANGEFRSAIDRGVAVMTDVNAIAGVVFLWYALILTAVGAVAGSEVPVAGNAAGAAAGLTVAEVTGIALVASVVATETARVARGIDEMVRSWDDTAEREAACRKIAEGVFALVLTAAMFYLGPGIQRVARSIIERAAAAVRTGVNALLREGSAALESLAAPAPLAVSPGGLAVPFAGPTPEPTFKPPTPVWPPDTVAKPTTPQGLAPLPSQAPTPTSGPAPASSKIGPSTGGAIVAASKPATTDQKCSLPTGRMKKDAIPIQWFKLPFPPFYPDAVTVAGHEYHRDERYPLPGPEGYMFGVDEDRWPKPDKYVRLKYWPRPRRAMNDTFREKLSALGWNAAAHGYQIDHVQDPQWGIADSDEELDVESNLWPADSGMNVTAGNHQNLTQRVSYCLDDKSPPRVNVPVSQVMADNMWGRYFQIRRIAFKE